MQLRVDVTVDRIRHREGITYITYRFTSGPFIGRTLTEKVAPVVPINHDGGHRDTGSGDEKA